jgi:multidrug efflux pump subunit AcrA (membrane-fusion protein)
MEEATTMGVIKMRKKLVLGMTIAMITMILSGCTEKVVPVSTEKIRGVEVVTIKENTFNEKIKYIGNISSTQILPYGLDAGGKIDNIFVSPGDRVETGDLLVTYTNEILGEGQELLSEMDGYVVNVEPSEGAMVAPGYPVVILRSAEQIVKFGMNQNDVKRIESESEIDIEILVGDKTFKGKLTGINQMPDVKSRTYDVTIEILDSERFLLGELCEVTINLDEIRGIWLPIAYVQNDGENYVFTVNSEERIVRKNLVLGELNDAYVRVDGLETGDRVVIVGNGFVREGQKVSLREAGDE